MILDSSKKFICLEYSNPIENEVINSVCFRIINL